MIPNEIEARRLHEKYAWNDELLQDVYLHCEITAEIALECVKAKNLHVDERVLYSACLLHDIGSYIFLSANEKKRSAYPQHAMFGATILREEGVDERICQAVQTHVLLGLTPDEIKDMGVVLPHKNFEPTTIEGRLLCYADRFSSKGDGVVLNSYETFLAKLKKDLPKQAEKFEAWANEFGLPDVQALAKKHTLLIV